jgi:galactokinase
LVLSAKKNTTESFYILMPNISLERSILIPKSFQNLEPQDYLAAALRVIQKHGCIPLVGYNILIKSDIPINAGVSSSSAVVVAFVHFLLKAFGCDQQISSEFITQPAYEAEVMEHKSPGGKMDQYTIAIGNIIYIDTASDFQKGYRNSEKI